MTYQIPTFKGDKEFSIDCTGDACVGDHVKFEIAEFTGRYRNSRFSHFSLQCGEIIKDSYGEKSQQHTFTIKRADSTTFKIKGRNLYRNKTWRKKWENESLRRQALQEKHSRGNQARTDRQTRLAEEFERKVLY